jgi:hypothetical protein
MCSISNFSFKNPLTLSLSAPWFIWLMLRSQRWRNFTFRVFQASLFSRVNSPSIFQLFPLTILARFCTQEISVLYSVCILIVTVCYIYGTLYGLYPA